MILHLRKELLRWKNKKTRSELTEEISNDRLKKIEKAMESMGVTLEDIFSGEARLSLVGAKIVKNYAEKLDDKRRQAVAMLNAGIEMDRIREKLSLKQGEINDIITDFGMWIFGLIARIT